MEVALALVTVAAAFFPLVGATAESECSGGILYGSHCVCAHPRHCTGSACTHAHQGPTRSVSGWIPARCPDCECTDAVLTSPPREEGEELGPNGPGGLLGGSVDGLLSDYVGGGDGTGSHGCGDGRHGRRLCTAAHDSMLHAGSWLPVTALHPRPEKGPCFAEDDPVPSLERHLRPAGNVTHNESGTYVVYQGNGCKAPDLARDYVWHGPQHCAAIAWDAGLFCRVLGPDRTLLVIGDSTLDQSYAVLRNMVTAGGGGCADRIYFAQSDNLLMQPYLGLNRGVAWLEVIAAVVPDLVVLGTGAHIHFNSQPRDGAEVDEDAAFKAIFREVAGLSKALPMAVADHYAAANKSLPVIMWKTIQPGGCSPTATPWNRCYDNDGHGQYNYENFLPWDNWVVAQDAMPVVDIRMTYWRNDAHVGLGSYGRPLGRGGKDCLHYNMRTAVLSTTFPRMLLHTILQHDPVAMDHATHRGYQSVSPPRYRVEKIAEHSRCGGSDFEWVGGMSATTPAGCAALARSLPRSEVSHDLVMHATFNDGNCRLVAPNDACEVESMVPAPLAAVYRITDIVGDIVGDHPPA